MDINITNLDVYYMIKHEKFISYFILKQQKHFMQQTREL